MNHAQRNTPFRAFLGLSMAIAIGCGSDGTDAPGISSVAITDVNPRVGVGATLKLSLAATNTNGEFYLATGASWTSSADAIATVANDGTVGGHALGSATITATLGGKNTTVNVLVTPAVITISPAPATLAAGASVQLTATARDASGAPIIAGEITWSVEPTGVVTVSPTGLVTAVTYGLAKITATASGRSDHLELGIPSAYDGDWSGTNTVGTAVLRVQFGTALSVQLTKTIVQCGTRSTTIDLSRPIVNGVFTLTGTGGAIRVTGRFTTPGQETLSVLPTAIAVTTCDNGQPPFPGTNTSIGGEYSLAR